MAVYLLCDGATQQLSNLHYAVQTFDTSAWCSAGNRIVIGSMLSSIAILYFLSSLYTSARRRFVVFTGSFFTSHDATSFMTRNAIIAFILS